MYHSCFIHSSVSGHLGCFHVLAILNIASLKFEVHVSFSIVVFSGYMPSSGIVGSHDSFIASFLTPFCLPLVDVLIYSPTNSARGTLFSTPSPEIIVCRSFFNDGHPDRCEMISHCSFDLHFSNNE